MKLSPANQAARSAAVLAAINDRGQTTRDLLPIGAAMGLGHLLNFRLLLAEMVADGRLCFCRAKRGDATRAARYFFISEEARDAFAAEESRIRKARAKARDQARKPRIRPNRPRKAKAAPKPKPIKVARTPKPKPVKAPKLVALPPRSKPAPKKPRVGALIAGPADESKAVRIVAPKPVDRFQIDGPITGGFASLGLGVYAFAPSSCAARAAA